MVQGWLCSFVDSVRVYIFLPPWKRFPPIFEDDLLTSFPIFADFFIAPFLLLILCNFFPFFAISFPFLLFSYCSLFSICKCFSIFSPANFPLQIFPILKSFPNLMKNLPQPGGGGLFQENIRPCKIAVLTFNVCMALHHSTYQTELMSISLPDIFFW